MVPHERNPGCWVGKGQIKDLFIVKEKALSKILLMIFEMFFVVKKLL